MKNYAAYIASDAWKVKATATKKRDGNRCAWCGNPASLQVHHLTYQRIGNEIESDLITLCNGCHAIATAHARLVRSQNATQA